MTIAPFNLPTLMAPRATLDFETRSDLDLTEVGNWKYAEDPTTQILCLSYSIQDGPIKLWTPWVETTETYEFDEKVGKGKKAVVEKRSCTEPAMAYHPELCPFPQELIDFVLAGGTLEAHNVGMERSVWFCILVKQFGVPPCNRWVDTQATCAYRALPLALEEVGEVLDLETQKDKEGKTLIRLLCKPRKPTKTDPRKWCNDPALFDKLFKYCLRDNETEKLIPQKIGDLPRSEYGLWVLDQTINTRGIRLDHDAVHAAIQIAEKASQKMEAELQEITKGRIETGNQRDRFIAELQEHYKIVMPDMQAGTIKETLKDKGIPPYIRGEPATYARRLLEIRQELCRTSTQKLYRMRECVCADGRIRGLLQYHGAGTGRWAGRLVQPQNFPRPKINGKPFKGDINDLITILLFEEPDVVRLCYGPEMETLAAALRGMFIAAEGCDFITSDFSSIEARIVLWLAGQMEAMDIFRKADRKEGPDIYCYLARDIYGREITKNDAEERQLGKIGVLGCGYQMSAPRLQEQAHDDYELDLELDLCERIVKTYRTTFYKVKKFWYAIEETACNAVILNTPTSHRGILYEVVNDAAGKWLTCRLPSGRRIWYFNPHITYEPAPWSKDKKNPEMKPKLWYQGRDNKRGGSWSIITTYGGMLTENIVQAIARDIMAEAMIRAEKAAYKIVLTVHDEVVSEVPKGWGSQEEFDGLMAQPPLWLPDMPIAVEGWRGPRYHK